MAATFLNITAVGTFGLAVTSPLLEHARIVSQQSTNYLIESDMIKSLIIASDLSWWQYVSWPFAIGALAVHVMAHMLMGLIDPEE
ncbi:MAG: hypothetical protein M5U35_07870 [Roseovarius sp.]|nr:hypothetical protein [Roseovarius sp.]